MSDMRKLTERTFVRPEALEVHVAVRVPLDGPAYQSYTREQIRAIIEGIGRVVAAAELGKPAQPPVERLA